MLKVFDELKAILTKYKENIPVIAAAEMLAAIDEAEVKCDGGWIPCSSGQMPRECEEVDVTIEEIDGVACTRYTSTSWLQDGVWVVKKTALKPRVIAWKPKNTPYMGGE